MSPDTFVTYLPGRSLHWSGNCSFARDLDRRFRGVRLASAIVMVKCIQQRPVCECDCTWLYLRESNQSARTAGYDDWRAASPIDLDASGGEDSSAASGNSYCWLKLSNHDLEAF